MMRQQWPVGSPSPIGQPVRRRAKAWTESGLTACKPRGKMPARPKKHESIRSLKQCRRKEKLLDHSSLQQPWFSLDNTEGCWLLFYAHNTGSMIVFLYFVLRSFRSINLIKVNKLIDAHYSIFVMYCLLNNFHYKQPMHYQKNIFLEENNLKLLLCIM